MEADVKETKDKAYILKVQRHDFKCMECEYTWTPLSQTRESAKCPRCRKYTWRGEPETDEVDESKPYVIPTTAILFICQHVDGKGKKCEHTWEPRSPDKEPQKCPVCQRFDWRGDVKKT